VPAQSSKALPLRRERTPARYLALSWPSR
jgi:hypothetical protein